MALHYDIEVALDAIELRVKIERKIGEGWRPQGGASVSAWWSDEHRQIVTYFCQAVVREGR